MSSINNNINAYFEEKKVFFATHITRSYEFRLEQLQKLKQAVKRYETDLIDGLQKDLHKPIYEAFISEIGLVYTELSHAIAHLKKWMKPQRVETPIAIQPSSSNVYAEPLGIVLIIGPWNYPYQLLFTPLIGAIAAGNCAVVKPSDNTKNVAIIIEKIISETFSKEYISVVQGPGAVVGQTLIEKYRFDHIFFTGSTAVGKKIMEMAAKTLTPVTLELGGKSPAIVDEDTNIDLAAKNIAWGKFFNAGQTCISPDYVLVPKQKKQEFIAAVKKHMLHFFGADASKSKHYARIVNKKRIETLENYLSGNTVLAGGKTDIDHLYFEPTLVDEPSMDHPIMREEIFGPIMPIISYEKINEVFAIIQQNPFPLALYLFTNNKEVENKIIHGISFGGGCVNNTMAHFASFNMPFGGVGYSGVGRYHGAHSFQVFSHYKGILKTNSFFDPGLKYAPYTNLKMKIARLFLR